MVQARPRHARERGPGFGDGRPQLGGEHGVVHPDRIRVWTAAGREDRAVGQHRQRVEGAREVHGRGLPPPWRRLVHIEHVCRRRRGYHRLLRIDGASRLQDLAGRIHRRAAAIDGRRVDARVAGSKMFVSGSPTEAPICPPTTSALPSGNRHWPLQNILVRVFGTLANTPVAGLQTRAWLPKSCPSQARISPVGSRAALTATIGQVTGAAHWPAVDPVGVPTVTATEALVLTLPAKSVALACRVWFPATAVAVSHATLNGALLTGEPSAAPSSRNCTDETPTLSVAFAETDTVFVTVAPLAGEVILTDGGVVSVCGGGAAPETGVSMSTWISAGLSARL